MAGRAASGYRDRLYYGRVYHLLFDRALDAGRSAVVDLVPEGARVLDIACGTGDLCFALRREKHCRVVGIDMSPRMIAFAAGHNRYEDVEFTRCDATDLGAFSEGEFECATVTLLLHELPREAQARVVTEALRVARQLIVADWCVPLPANPMGLSVRLIEWIGMHHYRDFTGYLARGGINGILKDLSGLQPGIRVRQTKTLPGDCREIVALSRGQVQPDLL